MPASTRRGYALLLAAFAVLQAVTARSAAHGRWQPLRPVELATLGLATHKLSRIVATEQIASPLRAPFTADSAAQRPVATGLRRSVGELLVCPYCVGAWIAGALVALRTVSQRLAGPVTTTFAVLAVADLLHPLARLGRRAG